MHDRLSNAFSLQGRVAVVTGAASGIGREAAIVFAQAGARVVIADLNAAGLDETATLIGASAVKHVTDVTDHQAVERLAQRALDIDARIDVWANVAGFVKRCPIIDATPADLDQLIAVNLKGVYWGCAAAARAMRTRHSGSIINISSNGADSCPPGMSIYAMTKAGVNALTRSVAREMGAYGIRANTVSPGFVETPLASWSYTRPDGTIDSELREKALQVRRAASVLGMTGEPSDIAFAMLYLAADASRFVTGQNLRANGGVSMV